MYIVLMQPSNWNQTCLDTRLCMVNDYYLVVLVTMVAMMDTNKQIIHAGNHHHLSQHS